MNDKDRHDLITRVFLAACELPEEKRAAFLDEQCADEPDLRADVEAMLSDDARDPHFLESPALGSGFDVDQAQLAQPAQEPTPPKLAQIVGFKILRVLGEGGMGVVYLADQDKPLRRKVALKLIKLGMDTKQVIARFESERQALAMMDHPGVARVFDAGATEQGRPYFVMEHVPGIPITDYCDKHRLATEQRLRLFMQVCEAVQHAHQKGIIHRDLKPSNVLVSLKEGEPVSKVIDFGVAKATQQKLTEKTLFTEQGQLIGTPAYMSPEQAEMTALDIDTRSDIYSLGVILYELLAGAVPFEPSSLREAGFAEIQRIIREEEPPKPSTRLSGLREGSASGALAATECIPGSVASEPGWQTARLAAPRSGSDLGSAADIAKKRHTDPNALIKRLRGDLDWITMKALEKDRTRRYASATDLAADLGRHLTHDPVVASPPSRVYRASKFVRRNRMAVFWTAIACLGLLSAAVTIAWFAATSREIERQRDFRAYLACLTQAAVAIGDNDISLAHTVLAKAPEGLRGWEWNYLAASFDDSIGTIPIRGTIGDSVAFSPDGSSLATITDGSTVKLWNPRTLDAIGELRAEIQPVSIAFSADGRKLAAGSVDGRLCVIDVEANQQIAVWTGHHGRIMQIAFSPTGDLLASASWDGTVKLWNGRDETPIMTLSPDLGRVNSVAFDPTGNRIASGTLDHVIVIWSSSGREISRLIGHSKEVYDVAFNHDGTKLASASWDETVRVWNLGTGVTEQTLIGHTNVVKALAFDPGGLRLASGGRDGLVKVWNADTGEILASFQGHPHWVSAVAFSPDGRRLASGSLDGTVKLWGVETYGSNLALSGHANAVESISFHPAGALLASGSADGTVRVWRPGGEPMVMSSHTGKVWGVAYHPDGRQLVSGSADGSVKIWDTLTGQAVSTLRVDGSPVLDVAVSPSGELIASASQTGVIQLWSSCTGEALRQLRGHEDDVFAIAFDPTSRLLASGSKDKTVRVWDVESGFVVRVLRQHSDQVHDVTFDYSGRQLASAAYDGVRVWEVTSGRQLLHIPDVGFCNTVAFHPDGSRIAFGTWGRAVTLCNMTGEHMFSLHGHDDAIWDLEFSPDGSKLASASADWMIRIWDTVPYARRHRQREVELPRRK